MKVLAPTPGTRGSPLFSEVTTVHSLLSPPASGRVFAQRRAGRGQRAGGGSPSANLAVCCRAAFAGDHGATGRPGTRRPSSGRGSVRSLLRRLPAFHS